MAMLTLSIWTRFENALLRTHVQIDVHIMIFVGMVCYSCY